MELPELKGYLRKKSRQDRWQRRYFEATTHYLTYYKNRDSEKLLACIDLWRTQNIDLNPHDADKLEFSIQIGDQSYLLKAENADDAMRWVKGLRGRQSRPDGAPSETFSMRSERFDRESDASSDIGGRRPGYASSDTGSVGSTTKSRVQTHRASFTDSSMNPIVPNADAIAAGRYPMLKTDQQVRKYSNDPDESKMDEEEKKKRSINEMFGDDDSDDDDQIRPVSSNTTADASGLFGSDSESDEEEERKPRKKVAPPPSKKAKAASSSSSAKKQRRADKPAKPAPRRGSGDEYDSGDEIVRTKDDDAFIDQDDDLEDVLGEYDEDDQKFEDERPLPEDVGGRKEEDYFEETLKSLKTGRRAKMNLSVQEQEQIVQEVLYRMDKAHADDLASIAERKPALERIKYVDHAIRVLRKQQLQPTFLDFDLLSFIKKWIQPLEDGTLPNLGVRTKMLHMVARLPVMKEHLKRSGFGKVVMMLWKHPEETRDNKDLCRDLIERWSRAVFDKTLDYSKLAELEAEKAENMGYRRPERRQQQKPAVSRSEYGANPFSGRTSEPKDGPVTERAILPSQLRVDFLHRPQPKVDVQTAASMKVENNADTRKSRLSKRMLEIARPGRKSKRSVNLSIEGR
ncbi:hypothetical protein Poli38472_000093 [Pythium oligandrum]|uniref:TFIIS N-terminal domain-containing protein n=1 Tax=Pythium oligandrum TaxID=41045 RepID=A0A8K1CB40_PYTOL|nr:hypothetical protein Poli38472_000093 [Pythium oligandrum]|eukprot:TMW60051.1 hypothetical protein Poli38472_000093 [Pythium oligandrum]